MVHIPSSQIGIVVAKTLILVLGGLITYFSYKTYRRTGAAQHWWLTLGFGVITVGAILGGALDLVAEMYFAEDLLYTSVFISSSMTAVGLGVILYSLYAR
ncbi:DUF7521 family protein [Haloarcula salinisoli]|uniref:Uncharacterized protein n=1 Tax=Haloarcula salinisoli TaxID=2487746 RepID=A0A8J7YI46_9EURY|nr:hypothetical protein [Halomicroarcula salinisoli]MBX0284776.1 hypothetical protein [Halomicroarcula salinisoli]MBX0303766.1 hypothetical protein [Halomicroarcula salinisoli]